MILIPNYPYIVGTGYTIMHNVIFAVFQRKPLAGIFRNAADKTAGYRIFHHRRIRYLSDY